MKPINNDENLKSRKKPVEGVTSRKFWLEDRLEVIKKAMIRYIHYNQNVPDKIINEYHILLKDLKEVKI